MTIDFYLLFAYVVTIFLFLSTPGPVTVLVISTSVQHGIKASLLTIAGTNLASLTLIALSFLAIEGLLAINEKVFTLATLAGTIYLMIFAISIIKDQYSISTTNQVHTVKKHHFKNAFIIGLSNPKDIIFFMAFFPSFLSITSNVTLSMAVLTFVWIALDYAILFLYALFFSKVISSTRAQLINKLSGITLLLIAIYAFFTLTSKL